MTIYSSLVQRPVCLYTGLNKTVLHLFVRTYRLLKYLGLSFLHYSIITVAIAQKSFPSMDRNDAPQSVNFLWSVGKFLHFYKRTRNQHLVAPEYPGFFLTVYTGFARRAFF